MPGKNRNYPHLLQPDIELWERFLDANPDKFSHYDYDVRVGLGRDPGAASPENIRRMSIDLSQRRIDAIGYTDSHLTIIEITLSAGLRAIGQLLAYPLLYREAYKPTLPIKLLLVASQIQTDMQSVFDHQKIPYLTYPE